MKNGTPVNELEAIYLPMFKSTTHGPEALLHESVMLIRQLDYLSEEQRLKIIALALMVSNKIVSKEELSKLWEVAKMMKLKILEVAEEQGIEQGIEQGVDISADIIRDLLDNTPVEEIAARYKVTIEKVKRLQAALPPQNV